MKILHTADWHLGKKLYTYSRLEEQKEALDEIAALADAEEADLVVVAGDLYDVVNPSNDATELFYRSLRKLSNNGRRPIIAIAGNHDSPDRIEAPDPLAKELGIILVGYPHTKLAPYILPERYEITHTDHGFLELRLPGVDYPIRCITTPYASEIRLRKQLEDDKGASLRDLLKEQWHRLADAYCDAEGVNLLTAHLFVSGRNEIPEDEPEGEKPIKIGNASIVYPELFPEQVQYVALGHLHRAHFVTGGRTTIAYSGSPIGYSFAESGYEKKVHVVKLAPGKKADVEQIPLKSGRALKRKAFTEVEPAVEWLSENREAYTELTMRTQTFLTSEQLRALREASPLLLNIIPEPEEARAVGEERREIDLSRSVEELFVDFFKKENGQEPNEEIIELFRELNGQPEE